MSSSTPQLPIELYRPIVLDQALSLSDLYSLSLTTRSLSSEAYAALYTRIELCTSQTTHLALRTLLESDRVAQIVKELILQPVPEFRIDFGKATPLMIDAIHRMENLKKLTIGYAWTSDPFGESRAVDASVINQQQSGPRGPGRTAWTRGLKIPNIERLTVQATTYRPIRDLFGTLPYPLQHFVSIRPIHVRDLVGIRRVTCERVYGGFVPSPDAENETLNELESLEVMDLDSYPTQDDWAPNLKTVMMNTGGGRGEYYIDSRLFQYMKSVKKLGPTACDEVSEDLLDKMSQLRQLEGMVLILSRISYRDFDVSDMERMKRAAPCLLWIALVPSDRNHPGIFREYTKWTMKEKIEESGAVYQKSEPDQWFKVTRKIEDWSCTLSNLLGMQ